MKFNFRKIASVLTSAVMLSSTVGLAAAANYPAPYVQGGNADVAIVWGSTSAQSDLVAVTDITSNLQATLAKQTVTSSGSSGTSVSGGDFVKLAKSSDNVNLGNSAYDVFGATVNDDDLSSLLMDGTYLNDENTEYDYEQKVNLGSNLNLSFFADSDYKSKEPTVGIKLGSNKFVLNYTVDFTTDAESDVTSSDLVDFETTDLNILGRKYYVLDAKNGSTAAYFGKFTFLDSADTGIATEGETTTIQVGDKSYDVSINFIGSSTVKLDVNGQVTNTLSEGETYRLTDGTYVGVKDILYNSKDAGISKVEFSLGSGKLEIESGSDIELNDESISGLKGWVVRGSASADKQTLDKIVIQWHTDDEEFVTSEESLEMPGFKALKLSMGEFYTPAKEVTKISYDGDDSIEIEAPIKDGTARFNILYANATGDFVGIGKDSDELLSTHPSSALLFNQTGASNNVDRWFVASYATSSDAESYLLSASITESNNKNRTTIKNEVTGQNVCEDKVAGDTCNIGDVSLTIVTVYKTGADKWVNFSAGTGVSFNTLFTKDGLNISLPFKSDNVGDNDLAYGAINFTTGAVAGHSPVSFYVFMTEEDKDDDNSEGNVFNVTLDDDSDNDVHVSAIGSGQTALEVPGSDDDTVTRVVSDLGTKITKLVSSDKGIAEIEYSGGESYADILLTAPSASVSSGSGSGGSVKELGSVSVKDSEVSSVSGKNLVVVGGSCVNSVAAELLGGAYCGADFESKTTVGAGSFLIKTYSRSGGKIATLVAGYNAGDTSNAAKYLTTQTVDTTVGKAYVGTSATSAGLMTSESA